jgi:hypothetical protein
MVPLWGHWGAINKLPKQKGNTMNLSDYLTERSKEICADNHCTEDEHNCESYAYITAKMELLDICSPDFFQGYSSAHAAISLPWSGTQAEIEDEVLDQCSDGLLGEGYAAYVEGTERNNGPYSGEAETIWQQGWDEAQRAQDAADATKGQPVNQNAANQP